MEKINDIVDKDYEDPNVTPNSGRKRKRGEYSHYTPEQKAKIVRFAIDNGNSRAAKHFSESMGRKINESTIRSFKAAYHFRKAESGKDIIVAIDSKKCCRPKLLPEPIDKEICEYIKDLRNAGGIVNSIIVQSVAKGIILDSDQSLLTENGGHVELTKD